MNGKITRLGIVVLSAFALVIGSSVCYSMAPPPTAEDCEGLEAYAGRVAERLETCDEDGDCGEVMDHLDFMECEIANCWNAVDQVCSDTGCVCGTRA
ncbi:MAG: hypothetical protein IH987_04405 [Planctomycetes bacterium]|nr:hypothetical protein [Planctomycetota bacterium]